MTPSKCEGVRIPAAEDTEIGVPGIEDGVEVPE